MNNESHLPRWWPFPVLFTMWLLLTPPLMHPCFFYTHDAQHMFDRVVELNHTLDHSPFGSRWLPHLADGYGLPVFYLYPPLFFYCCAFLHCFGLTDAQTMRAVLSLTILFSGLAMYHGARDRLPRAAAIVSAVAYMAAPYHLVDLYTRGAPAECMVFVFLPLFFCYATSAITDHKVTQIVPAAFSLAAIVLSYHLVAFMTLVLSPLLFIIADLHNRSRFKRSLFAYVSIILLGMGLASFYWLPMIVEGRIIRTDKVLGGFADFHNHFLFLHELFERDWGDPNFAAPLNPLRGMMFQIGLPYLLIAVGVIIFLWVEKSRRIIAIARFYLAVFFISIFFMFSISIPVWERIPYFPFILFPWRFLLFVVLSLSFLSGFLLWQLHRFRTIPLPVSSTICIVLMTWYGTTCFKTEHDPILLTTTPGHVYASGTRAASAPATEFVPKTVKTFPQDAYPEKFSLLSGKGTIHQVRLWPQRYEANLSIAETAVIKVDTIWFPGWTLYVDDIHTDIQIDPMLGTMQFSLSPGSHTIHLILKNTIPRKLGLLITFLTILLVGWLSRDFLIHQKSRKWIPIISFLILLLLVYRAPWQRYPPSIARDIHGYQENKINTLAGHIQADIFAGDIWDTRRHAETYCLRAEDVFPFHLHATGRIFSARFSANLQIDDAGEYAFRLESNDSAWLCIDDHIVTRCAGIGTGIREGEIPLNRGSHFVIIYYHNIIENGHLSLKWRKSINDEWQTLPTSHFFLSIKEKQNSLLSAIEWKQILTQP
ncbi:MAG: hypothetical protein C4527_23890 [Candidatus Omnitrophota bacterium]|jgi:hypothetical protein|nr:MAG: hypothetical protein C4527_23890 [Candidatus Omnitrophota bacterium]